MMRYRVVTGRGVKGLRQRVEGGGCPTWSRRGRRKRATAFQSEADTAALHTPFIANHNKRDTPMVR